MQKVGIIGAGGMAAYHIAGFRKAGAQVVGVCDVNLTKAESYAKENGIEYSYTSFAQMKKDIPDLTAVSVITPNKFHFPLVIEALQSGCSVFCEKPPAMNEEEAAKMAECAQKTGKKLMFNFNNRARQEVQALFAYIKQGTVGTINSAQATWIRRNGIPGFGGWFTDKKMSGGGAVIDLVHMLDLALYFMDYPHVNYVSACTYDTFIRNKAFKGPWGIPDTENGTIDVEASCHAFIVFTTGQCLTVRSSWAEMNEREVVSVAFQGTKAGGKAERLFACDGIDETAFDTCRLYTEENGHQVNRNIQTVKDTSMGRVDNAANFIYALDGTAEALNSPDQAVKLMRIIDALYASAASHKPVMLNNINKNG